MMYRIIDHFFIKGRGKVYTVEFDKAYKRKEYSKLIGTKLDTGEEIIGVELAAIGDECYLKSAGLLVREKI